jgi:hypothetical protein
MGTARRGRCSLLELRDRQRIFLEEWAASQGSIFQEDPTLSLDRRQAHGEHCVGFHPESSCWWKTTHPGKCGVGAEFHYDELPPFQISGVSARELLPSEYLDRLIVHNEEFGDDIRLEGYLIGEFPSLVISQPDIVGEPATAADMELQMAAMGYLLLPGLNVGKAGSISFYHAEKRIALFDAHPGNFFRTGDMTLPVDGIILKITEDAEHAWLMERVCDTD